MSQLLIEVDTPEDEALLMQLLPRLNARLVGKQEEDTQKLSFIEMARKIVARGGAGESFGDPSDWQREIRRDRVLDGRDE